MDNLTAIIFITSLTLAAILTFSVLYFKTEKTNRLTLHDNIESLKEILTELKSLSINTASDISGRLNELRKEVKLAQDQANAKMNSGFAKMEEENKEIRKETSSYISTIQTTFKDYADRVDKLLAHYANDTLENQRETNQLKQQIQQELQNILKEIKSPLDLD